jgi:hypothetical protein
LTGIAQTTVKITYSLFPNKVQEFKNLLYSIKFLTKDINLY